MSKTRRDTHRLVRAIAVRLRFHLFKYFFCAVEIAGKSKAHIGMRRMAILKDWIISNQLRDRLHLHIAKLSHYRKRIVVDWFSCFEQRMQRRDDGGLGVRVVRDQRL